MPRKLNHGVQYEVDDDDYDDYDYYDDDYDAEYHEEAPEPKQDTSKQQRLWRCSICTYDNEESLLACDICGVIRNPVAGNFKDSDTRIVDNRYKDSGVSKMARSLFSSLPNQTPQKAVVIQQQKEDLWTKGCNNFHKHESVQGDFNEFHKAFSSHSHSHVNIAPFKFDLPSPDDLVSNGLRSSKMGSKANFPYFKSPRVSSSITEKTGTVSAQSTAKRSDESSLLMTEGKQSSVDESSHLINGEASKNSDSSSSSFARGGHKYVDESSYLKNGKLDIQTNDGMSESSSALMQIGKYKSVDNSSSSSPCKGQSNSLTSNLSSMSLSDKSGNSSNVRTTRTKSHAQYQPEKWMLPNKEEDPLTQLNLAIVGHVDSGKSTLSGRMLHLLGRITQKEMHKYEKDAKSQGKGSFAYAWALDESPEERERGITMTVAVAYFDTKRYHVVLLDSPGHKDFVPNMISGVTQADVAILVIDAYIGAFEAGMDSKGQTREHAQLIRSFGIDQIIVAVNKMDAVEYSQDRFKLIKTKIGTLLRSCNFKDSCVSWIPLSAIENQNLMAAPTDARLSSWYHGPNLLDAIDSLQPPFRDFSKPLLMPICDVIKSSSQGHVSVCGKLESGALRSGSKVLLMPYGEVGTVRSLERGSESYSVARAGDNVAVSLVGIDGSHVMPGGVLCHPDFRVAVAKHLELRVVVVDLGEKRNQILIGSQLEFYVHNAKEAARVVKLVSILDSKTGEVTKKSPRCLNSKQNAVIEVVLNDPVCVGEYSSCKALGRIIMRAEGRTIALGVVTRIIEERE